MKKLKKNRKSGNFQIMSVTWGFVLLFLGMIGYICYYSATNRQELINNSYNGRQELLLSQNTRGSIYSATGDLLAYTEAGQDGKEHRVYPYENLFAHIVGYATNGRMGVEAMGNYYLINSNAPLSEKAANDIAGEKYPGDDIYTTLDPELQRVAAKSLGVYKGAVVVTEPSTGKILAMVSKPDFNPDEISSIWEDLLTDSESSVLLNRATQGLYPPGSTFKIVTALEYIRENPDTYQGYTYTCNGHFAKGDGRINCYHGTAHGQIGFDRSFAKSCNSSFANIGLSLQTESFTRTLKDLLFGQDLPLQMSYNKSYVTDLDQIDDGLMMQVSIGQGTTQITPMHLNMITCAIANNGTLMKPYVIDRVENSTGNIMKQFSPGAYTKMMNETEAAALQKIMEEVVKTGTATRLTGLSYTAAGKTGSAEYGNIKGESHAWFTGYAPAENPEICVTIIIEGAGAGGDYAVPIAKRIFDAYYGL